MNVVVADDLVSILINMLSFDVFVKILEVSQVDGDSTVNVAVIMFMSHEILEGLDVEVSTTVDVVVGVNVLMAGKILEAPDVEVSATVDVVVVVLVRMAGKILQSHGLLEIHQFSTDVNSDTTVDVVVAM